MKYDMDNSTDKAAVVPKRYLCESCLHSVLGYLDWKVLPQNNPWHHTGSDWLAGEVAGEFQIDLKEAHAIVMEWMPDRMKTKREREEIP